MASVRAEQASAGADAPHDGAAYTAKQELIVRTAYRVMAERGVDRVSLQDVADAAEVSKGIILYHFKTKANLALAAMRWALTRVEERIRGGLEGADTAEDRIRAMIDAIFVAPDANRRFYLSYIELLDHAARFEPFQALHATFDSIVNALYAQVIAAGVDEGTFRVDPTEGARVVRAIIDGLFLQWLVEADREATHGAYRERCTEAVLSYLRAV